MTREERDHLRIRIDAEIRRRNLPEIRRQVERGPYKRNTRPRAGARPGRGYARSK